MKKNVLMHHLVWLGLCLGLCSYQSQAQTQAHGPATSGPAITSSVWTQLADVTFTLRDGYSYPRFGPRVKALQNKTIELEGYMFPFENTRWSVHFALSSQPLSACFFCGTGGPETVVEIETRQPVRQSDKPIRIKGTLVLNHTNVEKMIYVLKDATVAEKK